LNPARIAPARRAQSIINVAVQQLSDVGRNVIEGRIQVGADPLSRGDDGDRDKASNQRVFAVAPVSSRRNWVVSLLTLFSTGP